MTNNTMPDPIGLIDIAKDYAGQAISVAVSKIEAEKAKETPNVQLIQEMTDFIMKTMDESDKLHGATHEKIDSTIQHYKELIRSF